METVLIIYGVIACIALWVIAGWVEDYLNNAFGKGPVAGATHSIAVFVMICVASLLGFGIYYGLGYLTKSGPYENHEVVQYRPSPAVRPATPTPSQLPEPPPKKVKTSDTITRTPDYVGQVLIIDGYLDAEGFSCPNSYCYSILCAKPGCMRGYGTTEPVGGVYLMMPRSFYASEPKTDPYKRDDVKYRTHDGKIVGYRDRVQLVGKVVSEKGSYSFYVQKIGKL